MPEVAEHGLKAAHVSVRFDHRPADRVGGGVGLGDRAVQQRDAVVPFKVGGVGQDQVGVGDHFRAIGVGIDDVRDDVSAVRIGVGEHLHHPAGVHRRVPRHVGHVEEQRVDLVRVARVRVADHHMHQAVGGHRVFPRERLVDPGGVAVVVKAKVVGAVDVAEVGPVQRCAGGDFAMRFGMRGGGFGVGWFEAKAAGGFDRAEQDLQDMQRPRRLEAVGMRRDTAHGVEADGAAGHGGVGSPTEVGPCAVQGDRVVEGGAGDFGGELADAGRGDAGGAGHGFGGVIIAEIPVGHVVQDRAVGDPGVPVSSGQVGLYPLAVPRCQPAGAVVDDLRFAVFVTQEQAVLGGIGVFVDQHGRVGEAGEVGQVDAACLHQQVDEGEDEQAIRAGGDAIPVVGDGVIAGADRVYGDDFGVSGFQFAEADFDRVAVMILGDAEQQEHLGVVPVGLAEFPERASQSVDPGGGHVDRAKATVGGIVRGAVGLGPEAGERLRLVAAGEEGEFFGSGGADRLQPVGRLLQRLIPSDFFELAGATRAGAPQRVAQSGRRVDLHDPGGTFGAEHTFVDRVVFVALDIGHLHFAGRIGLEMHIDPAAAGTHVAGGLFDLVRHVRREVE